MTAKQLIVFFIAHSFFLSTLLFAQNEQKAQTKDHANKARIERIEFAVEGVTCDGCAEQVESALHKTDGVKAAEVSFDTRRNEKLSCCAE